MSLLFDSSSYKGELLCRDAFYFVNKFRARVGIDPLITVIADEATTGLFEDLKGKTFDIIPNDIMILCSVSDSGSSQFMSYNQYLLLKESGKTGLSCSMVGVYFKVEFDDITLPDCFQSLDGKSTRPLMVNLGDNHGYIDISSFLSEIRNTRNLILKDMRSFQMELMKNKYPSMYLAFIAFVSQLKFSEDYPVDMFNYIRPLLTNTFLYPGYLQYIKEVSIGDVTVDGGGSSSFTPVQAQLISKALCKILLTVDPFERDESVLEGAGINS